jgi:hypothetical protein
MKTRSAPLSLDSTRPLRRRRFARALAAHAGLALAAATLAACQTTGSTAPNAVDITYSVPTSITTSSSGVDNHFADVELVARKEVGLQFHIRQPVEVKNVVLSFWRAGNNAGEQTVEHVLNRSFDPGPSGSIGFTEYFEIPNGEDFEQCEGLYYMFAATYQVQGSSNALFIGGTKLILPTKRVVNGQIQQALCADPPPPEQ